jgi:hypothetical protein
MEIHHPHGNLIAWTNYVKDLVQNENVPLLSQAATLTTEELGDQLLAAMLRKISKLEAQNAELKHQIQQAQEVKEQRHLQTRLAMVKLLNEVT